MTLDNTISCDFPFIKNNMATTNTSSSAILNLWSATTYTYRKLRTLNLFVKLTSTPTLGHKLMLLQRCGPVRTHAG